MPLADYQLDKGDGMVAGWGVKVWEIAAEFYRKGGKVEKWEWGSIQGPWNLSPIDLLSSRMAAWMPCQKFCNCSTPAVSFPTPPRFTYLCLWSVWEAFTFSWRLCLPSELSRWKRIGEEDKLNMTRWRSILSRKQISVCNDVEFFFSSASYIQIVRTIDRQL